MVLKKAPASKAASNDRKRPPARTVPGEPATELAPAAAGAKKEDARAARPGIPVKENAAAGGAAAKNPQAKRARAGKAAAKKPQAPRARAGKAAAKKPQAPTAQAGKAAAKKPQAPRARAGKAAAGPPAKKPPAGTLAARAARRLERRLAGIRAAAGELARALDDAERAREAIEVQFQKAAEGNLARAVGALEVLGKAAGTGPLLDVRRLERDLATLVECCGELMGREAKGRKRDLWAVDDFLGEAARKLELAASGTATANLRLLAERLAEIEALRRSLQGAVRERFHKRIEASRAVLGALEDAAARLDERALSRILGELEEAIRLGKDLPLGKLEGSAEDLYSIDGLVKQVARKLGGVQEAMSVRTEESDG